jgi:F-type H+-transporting ATPase subunit b
MNINATLFGQALAFILFVAFCMKVVWPPIMKALAERKKHIADGLAAAEKGKHALELADKRVVEVLRTAKGQAAEILAHAEKRAAEVVEEAKDNARTEADHILQAAKAEIAREINAAREQLRASVAELAVAGASRILEKEVDAKAHAKLLDGVISQL